MDDVARFLSKVQVAETGCHEWQACLHRDGYGKFRWNGKDWSAHRAAYRLLVGEIPAGSWVLHRCDNRRCVNPKHLYLGDAKQNVRDKIERCKWFGRMKTPFEVIEKCRELYAVGWTQQRIADHLGVRQTQVSRYVRLRQRINR